MDDLRTVARQVIADFIAEEVGADPSPAMYEQADTIIERLADEGIAFIQP